MARYVTLNETDAAGTPVTEAWPTADREEVAPAVNEEYPEVVAVLIDEVVPVSRVTKYPDGRETTETYQMSTGNKIPDPSGATEPTGVTLTRLVDAGGELRVYEGDTLLKEYAVGEWRACAEDLPEWSTLAAVRPGEAV